MHAYAASMHRFEPHIQGDAEREEEACKLPSSIHVHHFLYRRVYYYNINVCMFKCLFRTHILQILGIVCDLINCEMLLTGILCTTSHRFASARSVKLMEAFCIHKREEEKS